MAWYWNASWELSGRSRRLSSLLWNIEALLAGWYTISSLLWLVLAIFIDPLRAAVPIIYVAAFAIYGAFVVSLLSTFGAFGDPAEV